MSSGQGADRQVSGLPDRKLDGMVQERWFSCTVIYKEDEPYWVDRDHDTGIALEYEVPAYSASIEKVWKVVEIISRDYTVVVRGDCDGFEVRVEDASGGVQATARAVSAPRAIAEAVVRV